MSPASGKHGRVGFALHWRLGAFLEEHPIGTAYMAETGFILARDPDVLLAPDLAFIRSARVPPDSEQGGFIACAPDVAIEIISPWDRASRVTEKVLEYLRGGVAEVWLIDPEDRTLALHRANLTVTWFAGDQTFEGSEMLPGFQFPMAALFE